MIPSRYFELLSIAPNTDRLQRFLPDGEGMALYQCSRTGMGRRLDVSMVGTVLSILEAGAIDYTISGSIPRPEGNRDPGISPFDAFEAKDGSFVMACGTDALWRSLCENMGQPELSQNQPFLTNAK